MTIVSLPTHQARSVKRYTLKPQPAPLRIRDTRVLLALTKALGDSNKAWVVWTLRGWIAHNQSKKKGYRNGHYWTFSTLDKWQAKHFEWITLKRLSTMMVQLVNQGVLIRTRRSVHCCYWYRVDETVLSALCASLPPANSLAPKRAELISQTAELKSETADLSSQTSEHKTVVKKQENLKQKKQKQQNTTTALTAHDTSVVLKATAKTVVVDPLPHPTTNNESGEYSLNSEAPIAEREDRHGEPFAVKAGHKDDSNDTDAISKVPLKVLSSADILRTDLIRFGVLPYVSSGLVHEYDEGTIRRALAITRGNAKLGNPPGALVTLLRSGEVPDIHIEQSRVNNLNQKSRDPSVVAWEEQIKRDMAQMIADDLAAVERAAQQQPPIPEFA